MSRSYGQQQVQDIIGYQYQDRTFLIEALHAGQRIFYFPKNVKEVASQRFGECAQGSKFDNDSTTPMAPNGDIGRSSDAPFPTIQHNPPNSSNRQMRYTVSKHPPYWVPSPVDLPSQFENMFDITIQSRAVHSNGMILKSCRFGSSRRKAQFSAALDFGQA